jgi:nucleotide-binding universal stress UspA family protein
MQALGTTTRVSLRNILLATDFSPVSEAALQFAEAVVRKFQSKIFAVHIIEPEEYAYVPGGAGMVPFEMVELWAKEKLDHLDERLKPLPHESILRHGEIGEVLIEQIKKHQADLLVMGTHGRSGLDRFLLGSVAEEVFRQAPCPVLTVGPGVMLDAPREIAFKHVLFATDFSPESLAAAPYAISMAQEFQANLTFLHAVRTPLEPLETPQVIIAEGEKHLHSLLPEDVDLWCKPECIVRFGDPAKTVLFEAKALGADLIVLGVRGAKGAQVAATHFAHAVAHEVVSHAPCPVLTARG